MAGPTGPARGRPEDKLHPGHPGLLSLVLNHVDGRDKHGHDDCWDICTEPKPTAPLIPPWPS